MSKTVYLVTAVTIMKLVFIEAILARERSVTNCLQQEIIKKEEYDIYSMLDFGHSGRIAKRVDKAIQYRSRYFYKVDVSTRH